MVYEETSEEEVAEIFAERLSGKSIIALEAEKKLRKHSRYCILASYMLSSIGRCSSISNAHRNNNSRMFKLLGPDTGYDSINDDQIAKPLVKILDSLEEGKQASQNDYLFSESGR